MAFESLQKLIRKKPTIEHLEALNKELNSDANDRNAGILASTMVENTLSFAIKTRLLVHEGQENKLFGFDSPIGTFESKIRIGYALRIYWHKDEKKFRLHQSDKKCIRSRKYPVRFR